MFKRILKWVGIGASAIFLLLIAVAIFAPNSDKNKGSQSAAPTTAPARANPTRTPTLAVPTATPTPDPASMPFTDLSASALRISYDDLFRNNETYVGKRLYLQGQVIQVLEAEKGSYQLRVDVTKTTFGYDDTVFLRYRGSRVLEKDVIELVGVVNGLITYKSVLGGNITIPDLEAIQARVVIKAGTR